MRPVRLEVEGFTAFRERTVVDFTDVDLFALCGPTGAGKTSVIDAITFALYGLVPRLDDKAVAPVVSQGLVEAKVRLDFTVGGEPYSVVRVVRAGSTKEARLVRGADGEVLGDKARLVTGAVEEVLGLDYRQFTTCVSLPQGEFARFLHAEPRLRQDLLVKLLGWGLYDQVRVAAGARAQAADVRREVAARQLAELADASEEAEAGAAARVEALAALRDRVAAEQPALEALAREAEAAGAAAVEADRAVTRLTDVAAPAGVAELAVAVAGATARRDAARSADDEAAGAVARAEEALAALADRRVLEAARADHAAHGELSARIDKGEAVLADRVAAETRALDAVAGADAAALAADEALHAARTASLAHTLAAELVVGEPCPVCRSTVTEAPHAPPADVAAAEQVRRQALLAKESAAADARAASDERVRVEQKLAGVREQLAAVEERLRGAPAPEQVAAALADIEAAEAALAAARAAATAAATQLRQATAALERAVAAEAEGRRAFDAVRDTVAALGPPSPARVDLAADWGELAAWVEERRPALEAEAARHREAAASAAAAVEARREALAAAARDAGVGGGVEGVPTALARAEAELDRIRRDRARAVELDAAVAAATGEHAVARSLAEHLKADRFERWLLDEALHQLVAGATVRLRELSGGAYSLCLDDKSRSFAVVDHVNAGHVRLARTLSGGETFLASLALALALADQVAAMAAGSAARLETVLLDEGFGTLDPDTLDVVASALEELGATGRMVGIVTHVQELAERLPVRFQVHKVGGAATVERVLA